jgi:NAD(P)-dependent dehydrogenase (short-subunit alcohol dehydrogenase family)
MDRLRGKVALISGGGGSIGAATARCFAAEGAKVVVIDLDEDGLVAVTDEIGPERCAYVETDVTDSDQVRDAVRITVERFGGLDVVFANAGVFGEHASITDYPEDVFDRVMAVNVRGSFLLAKHAFAVMREGGSFVFNSSIVGLMRTAVREVADRGIRVNSIHPGPVDNRFQHRIEVDITGQPEDRAAVLFEERIPLGRHAAPDEIARTVLFLACDDSSYITGATIKADGGLLV